MNKTKLKKQNKTNPHFLMTVKEYGQKYELDK